MLKNLILSLSMISMLAACGKKEQNPNSSTRGANCGSQVVADYNKVTQKCRSDKVENTAAGCIEVSEKLLEKYPNLNCKALITDIQTKKTREGYLTAEEIEKRLNLLKAIQGMSLLKKSSDQ